MTQSVTLVCQYCNTTQTIAILRLADRSNDFLERTLFPGQCLQFRAVSGSWLEVYSPQFVSNLLFERTLCDRLSVL
jgi:hypothetical protein